MIRKLASVCILLFPCSLVQAQISTAEVINAEKSFAKMALEENMQKAFLHYMNDSSVIAQQDKLIKGYPVISKRTPDTIGKLLWYPVFSAVAASGDFGYTTGPYTYNIKGKNVAFGNYATVWQKQSDGQWKFVIDLGASHSDSTAAEESTIISILPTSISSKQQNLFEVEKMLNDKIIADPAKAYADLLHPDAHILRQNRVAYVTKQQKQNLSPQELNIMFKPEQYKIASSNDLGVVYGSCETDVLKDGEKQHQRGLYIHVWRKDGVKGWQLLHETIHM